MRCSDVRMDLDNLVDFSFCGVRHCLIKTDDDWVMIHSVINRSTNIDEVLS